MIGFTKRCLKVFFRDKTAVFFSLLSVLIVIGLYVMFLRDTILSGWEQVGEIGTLMDSWLVSGMLAVTATTTTLGMFGIMIDDKVKRIEKDFACSPLPRRSLVGGYILSGCIVGMLMSLLAFVISEIYLVCSGGELLSGLSILKILGIMALSVLSSSAMVFFCVSFFKSQSAFATASTILGTLIGFVTGVYIPIGTLPAAMQWVIKVFPISHAAVLYRQVLTEAPMQHAFGAAPAQAADSFREQMGLTLKVGNTEISALISVLVLVGTAVLFYCLALWNLSRKKK